MSTEMEHKGYTGRFEIDLGAGIVYGRVINIDDVVTFQGGDVGEAIEAFQESVDDYLEFCCERGEAPSPSGGDADKGVAG